MSSDAPPPAGTRRGLAALASRAAHEPLLQFFAVALVLFSANSLMHGPLQRASGDSITVPEGRVQQIASSYRLLAGRLPSRAELQVLVDDFINEEIAYREAIAMGLDIDDTIVRRRMRQKLRFLVEDASASEEPSDEVLAGWLESHAAEYRLPERIAFRQVLASRDKRGAAADADVADLLDELRSGVDPGKLGDASMLPPALPLTTEEGVAALFGDAFASSLFQHAGEGWFGPIASPYGSHDVLIVSRERARQPTLDEVRAKLRSDWIEAKRMAAREEFQARMRERYEVTVEWPELYSDQAADHAAPTDVAARKRSHSGIGGR